MEQYVIGGVIGAVFGFAVAMVSARLIRRNMKKNDASAVMAGSMLRTLLDILSLLAVYLLRNILPFPFYGVIIGTALGLSVGNVIQAQRMGKQIKEDENRKKSEIDEVKG